MTEQFLAAVKAALAKGDPLHVENLAGPHCIVQVRLHKLDVLEEMLRLDRPARVEDVIYDEGAVP